MDFTRKAQYIRAIKKEALMCNDETLIDLVYQLLYKKNHGETAEVAEEEFVA